GNVRPWMKTVLVRVTDGFLEPGQAIVLSLRRSRVQTFCETRFQLRLFVDCFGADVYEEVEEQLSFPIVSGPAAKLVAVLPASAVAGQPTWAHVRAEDAWGNPAAGYRGTIAPFDYTFIPADAGSHRFESVRFDDSGPA